MRLNKLFIISIVLIGQCALLSAQVIEDNYYLFPVKPGQRNYLAGTMGELRSTHFHAGLDVKTDGVVGLPIYAAADGYITRIKISSGGYGNALYMLHTNGTTTVYAHLSKYQEDIANYIREEQYKKESFSIELFPSAGQFKFKKGDIIAYGGNSGSSSGPHLHFEIRDKNQVVLNPLRYGFDEIIDKTPPSVQKIALVPLDIDSRVNQLFDREVFTPVRNGTAYSIGRTITATGNIGVEILTHDRQDGVTNRNGVQKIELRVDGETWFRQEINKISFATTRDVIALTNYQEMKKSGARYNKLYVDDGNRLRFYGQTKEKGKLQMLPGKTHELSITLTDSYGNTSMVEFKVQGEKLPVGNYVYRRLTKSLEQPTIKNNTLVVKAEVADKQSPYATVYANRMKHELTPSYYLNNHAVYLWNLRYALPDSIDVCGQSEYFDFQAMVPSKSSFNFYNKHMNIKFPKNALYDSLFLTTKYVLAEDSSSEFFEIGPKLTPMKKHISVTLKPGISYTDKLKYKAYRKSGKGRLSYEGGQWEGPNFSFKTRDLGKYVLVKDSIPPTIKALTINRNQLSFRINDDLSGIKSFRVLVSGKWVLMNYDYKRKLIWSEKRNKNHVFQGPLQLTVTDNSGNRQIYTSEI